MFIRLLIAGLVIASLGCQHKKAQNQTSSMDAPLYFQTEDTSQSCINIDSFKTQWYSKHLQAMHEPRFTAKSNNLGFRFLWLRTFHRPISIRVINNGSTTTLFAIELDGYGGYEPGEMLRKLEMKMLPDQWQEIQGQFAVVGFWVLKSLSE